MARVAFTAGRVRSFTCPGDKSQAFMWDSAAPGLGLRVTPAGKPAFIFQSAFQGKTIRITIGSPAAWSIHEAQAKSRELQRQIDEGRDPREVKAEKTATDVAKRDSEKRLALAVGDVWPIYLAEGKPKRRDSWKTGYREDLELMSAPGGVAKKRGKGLTRPGPIYPLLALRLIDINEDTLKAWFDRESKTSKHQAARAWMMFRGFLRWCSARPNYRSMIDRDASRAPSIAESLPQIKKRTDCLEAAQLPGWFAATNMLSNATIAVYLKTLLLTGARREEIAQLKWNDMDFRWKKLTLADKVETTRTIPLTEHVSSMIQSLPRLSDYVFASSGGAGHINDPRASHSKVLKDAGIEGLTIHGLRRTFSLLGEAAGAPAGAIAQIMGHKPSATAEGYRPRSVDALRPYLQLIEKHILDQAEVSAAIFKT